MRLVPILLGINILVTAPAASQPPPAIDLRLPSDATGGGTLAVRLTIPPPQIGPRYEGEAPILVFVPGAQGVGGLNADDSFVNEGFVVVTFIFPGGSSGGHHSDGTYDYRGPRCVAALRDVLLFSGGRIPDDLGRTIDGLLPFSPLTEMVLLLGSSNGGPISMAALGTYGAELEFVTGYVGWENPTNGQSVLVELGGKFYDCDRTQDGDGNGIPGDDGKNPYLTDYGETTIGMEFERLAYDPTYSWTVTDPANQYPPVGHTGALFLDGNGNGVLDATPEDPECFDLDGDGVLEEGEDYPFWPTPSFETGSLMLHYSVEVTSQAAARDLYEGSWPADVADTTTCDEFWSWRDATRFYEPLSTLRPDLRCLFVFNEADHVQAAEEHIHIQQAYDGLRGGGIWCRLNPDEVYYRLVDPTPPFPPADNDANTVVSWPDMPNHHEPYGLNSNIATLAGVMEIADRARSGDWSPNLDGPVTAAGEPLWLPTLHLSVAPNPAGSESTIRWEIPTPGPFSLSLFDAAGRRRARVRLEPSAAEGTLPLGQLLSRGRRLAAGCYWLELRTSGRSETRPILLLGP